MTRQGPIKVVLDGRGPLTLRETDYVTSGGEGSIWRSGSTIVKLYTDPAKMQRDGMSDKIKLLTRLQHPGIVAPTGLVLDDASAPIGFYMPFVDGEPMSRVIVSDYRARTGFGDRDAIGLAQSMWEIVGYAHGKQALMVDANELNWLVGFTKGSAPAATIIDVDSWAVGRWPAAVIMPSIRDWNAKVFTAATDWFAWGIVSFQVFTGIHPFKGRLDGYKPGDLVQRMKDNASVFAPGARLPHSVRDFGCIPGPLLDWYQATFQQGKRSGLPPPSPLDTSRPAKAAQVLRAVTTASTGALVFEKIFERPGDPALRVWANGVVRLASGEMANLATGGHVKWRSSPSAEVVRAGNAFNISDFQYGEFKFTHRVIDGGDQTLSSPLRMNRAWRAGEQLFAVTERELVEVKFMMMQQLVVTSGRRWSITNGMTWLADVAVQDVLGAAFVVLPHAGGVSQVRVQEIDGANVVSGKAGGRFAAFAILDKAGNYRKLEITFDKTFTAYQAWTGPADSAELNMGILPRGVVATIVDDGELAIVVPTTGVVNKIQDRGITTAMKLAVWGEKIVYIDDGAVWQLRVGP